MHRGCHGHDEDRRPIRLKDYDYPRLARDFVTIVVQDRQALFGEVIVGVMQLNCTGLMAQCVGGLPNYTLALTLIQSS